MPAKKKVKTTGVVCEQISGIIKPNVDKCAQCIPGVEVPLYRCNGICQKQKSGSSEAKLYLCNVVTKTNPNQPFFCRFHHDQTHMHKVDVIQQKSVVEYHFEGRVLSVHSDKNQQRYLLRANYRERKSAKEKELIAMLEILGKDVRKITPVKKAKKIKSKPDLSQLPPEMLNIITDFIPDCEITIGGETEGVNYNELLSKLKKTTDFVNELKLFRPLPLTRGYCDGAFRNVCKIVGEVVCKDPNMSCLFKNCKWLEEINGKWDTSLVTSMVGMFEEATEFKLLTTSLWDTSNVTDMSFMFSEATSFNQCLPLWDTKSVTDMSGMFHDAPSFNQPLPLWDTRRVITMSFMFCGATSFNQRLPLWNTSGVTRMYSMFRDATAFDEPLPLWDTRRVTDMSFMFYGATSFNQRPPIWDTSSVKDMSSMFENAISFNSPLPPWVTSKVTDMSCMFQNANSFNQCLPLWDTNRVSNMSLMFREATSFTDSWDIYSGGLPLWDTRRAILGDQERH